MDGGEGDLGDIPGTAFRTNGKLTRRAAEPSPPKSLDHRLSPQRLSDLPAVLGGGTVAAIETVRGCPKRCMHCPIPTFHLMKVRWRSVDSLLDEMARLKAEGVTELVIVDQCFGVMPDHARRLVEGMIDRDLRFDLAIMSRSGVGIEEPELFDLLIKAGLAIILLFCDENTGGVLGPKCVRPTARQERHLVRKLRRAGVFVNGYTVVGTPGSSAFRDLRALLRNGRFSDVHSPVVFTPFAGTPVRAQLASEQKLLSVDPALYDYSNYLVDDGRRPILVKTLVYGARMLSFLDPLKPFKMLGRKAILRRKLIRRSFRSIPRIMRRIAAEKSSQTSD